MKKVIPFEKELEFSSMVSDITSISLDHSLKFIDRSEISGSFDISGTYKMTEASTLEEQFSFNVPFEISLTERFDLDQANISIDDFHYEIVNEDILKCNIDVLIEGIEEVEIEDVVEQLDEEIDQEEDLVQEEKVEIEQLEEVEFPIEEELVRECDGDKIEDKEKEIPMKEQKEIIDEENVEKTEEQTKENNNHISSLFESFASSEETFTTYSVYIMRQDDSLDQIMDKYKVTKEQLSDYNDLSSIEIGSKIIIPTSKDE